METDQLGVVSVSTDHDDVEEMFGAYADAGFENVEFYMPEVWEYLDEGRTVADLQTLLDDHGIACIGGFAQFDNHVTCFGTPATFEADNHQIVRNAELLDDLGAETMVVGADAPEDHYDFDDVLGHYAERFRWLGEAVAHTDVTLCIEFNWSPLLKTLRSAAEIARRTERENVGVLFDPAHYHCTPTKFDEFTDENLREVAHVHVDDMIDKPGDISTPSRDRLLPGEGGQPLERMFDRIEDAGYDGHFSIEMFNEDLWALPPAEAANRMYDSVLPYCDDD